MSIVFNSISKQPGKAAYFDSNCSAYRAPHDTPREVLTEWKRQWELCNCRTCYDQACRCRNSPDRFPIDADGKDQCLRLMKDRTPFVFRNGSGLVIEIPEEIVKLIRGKG